MIRWVAQPVVGRRVLHAVPSDGPSMSSQTR